MKKITWLSLLAIIAIVFITVSCGKERSGKPRVLVFSKTTGFRHSSIPNGIAAIQKLGLENGFDVDTTENAAYFNEDSLSKYATVIFLNTTGNVLNNTQEVAFERYIQAGGGLPARPLAGPMATWGTHGMVGGSSRIMVVPRPGCVVTRMLP